jgi:hypothetical protein
MKKAAFALTTLAALSAAPLALAQAPTGDPSSGTTPSGMQPGSTTQQAQPGQTQSTQSSTQTQMQTAPGATPPIGRTTTTAADATPIPTTPIHREPDTVTLNQSFRPNRPLLYTGGLIFLGSYVTTAVLTATKVEDGNGDEKMYLPVVGPWLHLADVNEDGTDTALVIGSGILQGAGVLMAAASLFIPEKVPAATIQAGNVKVHLTATSFGRSSGGLGAVGQF